MWPFPVPSRGPSSVPCLRLLPAFLLSLGLLACEPSPPPVLGGASSEGALNSIRLALEDEERERDASLEVDTVLVVETSNRSAPALEMAQELVEVPGMAAVIGHANSPASLASSQIYNRSRIVQIAPTATAEIYSEAGPFSFRMVPPDRVQGRFLAGFIEESLAPGSRIAVFYVNDDYGRGLRHSLMESLDHDRIEVSLDLPHTEEDVSDLDVDHHLAALQSTEPDLLVWIGRVPGLNALLPGIRDRLGSLPVVGGDGLSPAEILDDLGPGWGEVRYVEFLDVDGTPELREFRSRYEDRFQDRAGGSEALAYDAARLLLAALRDGARTGEEISRYLMSLGRERPPFPGITGDLRFDEHGNMDRSFVMRTIEPRHDP